jgi:hypothetical protein
MPAGTFWVCTISCKYLWIRVWLGTISAIECSLDTLWHTGSYLVSRNHAAWFYLDINYRDIAVDLLASVNIRGGDINNIRRLHYVLGLWAQQWCKYEARGEV